MSQYTSGDRDPLETIYLELSDGQSRKFYAVTVNGSELVLRYGRIGSSGQSSRTTYATVEQAQAEATKKINEKLRKGYTRVAAADPLSASTSQSASSPPVNEATPVLTATEVSSRSIDLATLPMAMDAGLSVLRVPLERSLVSIEITAICDPSRVLLNSFDSPDLLQPVFVLNLDALNNIAYHLAVRFRQGRTVQNAQIAGGWGAEENLHIPAEFVSSQPFTLRIAMEQTLVIYLNGQVLSRFAHRMPPTQIDAVRVLCPLGNVQVQSVQVFEQSQSLTDAPAAAMLVEQDTEQDAEGGTEEGTGRGIERGTERDTVPPFLQNLPAQFEPLRSFLEANLVPYIKIQVSAPVAPIDGCEDGVGDPLTIWQSKIGGNPYFPKDVAYPIDPDRQTAMPLLLQINCADVPPIDGFDFPRQGMLQFYLGSEPADADSTPGKYRVLYFPEISTQGHDLITDFSFIETDCTIRECYPEVYPITFAIAHDLFLEWRSLETTGLAQEIAELCGACHGWIWRYMDETQAGMRGSKLGGYADLHSNMDEVAGSTKGRLLLELVHPSGCDDSFLFFITNSQLCDRNFSEVEFHFLCD